MNWDVIAAIAELVGAVGVIGSLLFLGYQIRKQTVESRLDAASTLAQQWNETVGALAADRELATLFLKGGREFSSLDDIEVVQFSAHLGRVFKVFESMHLQHAEGRLDNETWAAVTDGIHDSCTMPGVKSWWQTRSHWYSSRFQKFIRPMIDDDEPQRMYKSRNQ